MNEDVNIVFSDDDTQETVTWKHQNVDKSTQTDVTIVDDLISISCKCETIKIGSIFLSIDELKNIYESGGGSYGNIVTQRINLIQGDAILLKSLENREYSMNQVAISMVFLEKIYNKFISKNFFQKLYGKIFK